MKFKTALLTAVLASCFSFGSAFAMTKAEYDAAPADTLVPVQIVHKDTKEILNVKMTKGEIEKLRASKAVKDLELEFGGTFGFKFGW